MSCIAAATNEKWASWLCTQYSRSTWHWSNSTSATAAASLCQSTTGNE